MKGIYASDINGMAISNVVNNSNRNSAYNNINSRFNNSVSYYNVNEQIRSPTTTVVSHYNSTSRINSSFRNSNNNSTTLLKNSSQQQIQMDQSQISFIDNNQPKDGNYEIKEEDSHEKTKINEGIRNKMKSAKSINHTNESNEVVNSTKLNTRLIQSSKYRPKTSAKSTFTAVTKPTATSTSTTNTNTSPDFNSLISQQNFLSKRGFRPSSVFKKTTKFLKASPNGDLNINTGNKSQTNNAVGLTNTNTNTNTLTTPRTYLSNKTKSNLNASEVESVLSKTITGDEDVENNENNENNGEVLLTSLENISNLNEAINKAKLNEASSAVKQKNSSMRSVVGAGSVITTTATAIGTVITSDKQSLLSIGNSKSIQSFSTFKRSKTNIVDEILQMPLQINSNNNNNNVSTQYSRQKSPSIYSSSNKNDNNENGLIIDNIGENEFVHILKQYRQTKDPQIIVKLTTPISPSQFSSPTFSLTPNLNQNENSVLQELRLPKTNNILFSGKSNYKSLTRYYDAGDYIVRAPIETETTTYTDISNTNNIYVPNINSNKLNNLKREPTFFINYINSKYQIKKYDKLMNYFLNNNSENKNQNLNSVNNNGNNSNGANANVTSNKNNNNNSDLRIFSARSTAINNNHCDDAKNNGFNMFTLQA